MTNDSHIHSESKCTARQSVSLTHSHTQWHTCFETGIINWFSDIVQIPSSVHAFHDWYASMTVIVSIVIFTQLVVALAHSRIRTLKQRIYLFRDLNACLCVFISCVCYCYSTYTVNKFLVWLGDRLYFVCHRVCCVQFDPVGDQLHRLPILVKQSLPQH